MGIIDDTITATNNTNLPWSPLNPDETDASALVFQAIVGPTKLVCLAEKMVAKRNNIVALEYEGAKFADIRAAILAQYSDYKQEVLTQLTADIATLAGS